VGIELLNIDCMEYMSTCKDKEFDLAIVDPPYGKRPMRKDNGTYGSPNTRKFDNRHDTWDIRPTKEYFIELERVSKHRIIWGFNYFIDYLEPTNSVIVWNKKTGANMFADCEIAWSNHTSNIKMFDMLWLGSHCHRVENLIHPTQKPIKLYAWLLDKYATKDMKILDTHLGSGSSAIAAYYFGCDFVGTEISKEYFENMNKRFKNETAQTKMF